MELQLKACHGKNRMLSGTMRRHASSVRHCKNKHEVPGLMFIEPWEPFAIVSDLSQLEHGHRRPDGRQDYFVFGQRSPRISAWRSRYRFYNETDMCGDEMNNSVILQIKRWLAR